MEDNVNLKFLIEKKYKIFHQLKKLKNNFKNKSSISDIDIFAQSGALENYYTLFCETNERIENYILKHKNIDDSEKDYFAIELAKQCELLYLEMKKELLKVRLENSSVAAQVSSSIKDDQKVRIEKASEDIQKFGIPKFSGELTDWADFRKQYRESVHLSSNFTNPQKFAVLKYLLPTDVFELIKNLYSYRNDSGYDDAWSLVEEKFSKRKNVEELLTTLMQQPSVNDDSTEGIVQLLETTKKCLNGLIIWNVETKNWDMFLIHILVQKLNEEIKNEWENINSSSATPKTLFDFFNFLNSKIKQKKRSEMGTVANSKMQNCIYCKEKHPLSKCDKFELLNIVDKLNFVENKLVCYRCLAVDHTVAKCWKPFKCRICHSKEHHYLLHKNAQLWQRSKSRENLLD